MFGFIGGPRPSCPLLFFDVLVVGLTGFEFKNCGPGEPGTNRVFDVYCLRGKTTSLIIWQILFHKGDVLWQRYCFNEDSRARRK